MDISALRRIRCSCKGTLFCFQSQHGSSHLHVTQFPGVFYSSASSYSSHTHGVHTHMLAYSHKQNMKQNKSLKNSPFHFHCFKSENIIFYNSYSRKKRTSQLIIKQEIKAIHLLFQTLSYCLKNSSY